MRSQCRGAVAIVCLSINSFIYFQLIWFLCFKCFFLPKLDCRYLWQSRNFYHLEKPKYCHMDNIIHMPCMLIPSWSLVNSTASTFPIFWKNFAGNFQRLNYFLLIKWQSNIKLALCSSNGFPVINFSVDGIYIQL